MPATQLEAILGRIPSGLFILTIAHEGNETGMLASWVMQAGFDPPMVTVAVKQGRYVAQWLSANESFVLNLLRDDQKSLLSHFGHGFEPGTPAFTGLKVHRTSGNLPALTDALGHLECRPKTYFDSGDHRIFLAQVLAGHLAADGQPYVHIRKNGLRY
ncbi:MAG TPA: flavin reductase family protein [Pirellulales bacterium]|nr:flavin reductase family protein [Pirellulales bacterium]